jgi:formylglycine-generating enzyme required for sulfatase activity
VTFAQYRRLCQETGHDLPPVDKYLGHNDPRYLAAPVTNISPQDARTYAQWAGRLIPVAQEWSAAATGPEGRRFPWGETLDRVEFPGNANAMPFRLPKFDPDITLRRLRTRANHNVCQAQNDQAVCGARDFVGLVREWIDPGANRDKDYAIGLPYIPGESDETEPMTLQHDIDKSFRFDVGFRCVLPLMERDLLPEAVKTVLDRWQPDI